MSQTHPEQASPARHRGCHPPGNESLSHRRRSRARVPGANYRRCTYSYSYTRSLYVRTRAVAYGWEGGGNAAGSTWAMNQRTTAPHRRPVWRATMLSDCFNLATAPAFAGRQAERHHQDRRRYANARVLASPRGPAVCWEPCGNTYWTPASPMSRTLRGTRSTGY